jgi:hypothetical protein
MELYPKSPITVMPVSQRISRRSKSKSFVQSAEEKTEMHPKDWPWSSWSYYAKGEAGLLRTDPLGERGKVQHSGLTNRKKAQEPHP